MEELKDEEDAKQLREDVKNQYKNPVVWIGLIMGILVLYGMYKIIMYLII